MTRALLGILLLAAACKVEWPRTDPTTIGKPENLIPCDPGPAGRFIVSSDSVGPFKIATATMDDVVSSCESVSTEWESLCCGMAVMARLDYPGVHVAAQQESPDSVPRARSPVVRWELTGDSVYVAGLGLMPATVAELAQRAGRGWAENPTYDDHDGPKAIACAFPTIAFRIKVPPSVKVEQWLVDTSATNRATRIIGMEVVKKRDPSMCRRVADSLSRSG